MLPLPGLNALEDELEPAVAYAREQAGLDLLYVHLHDNDGSCDHHWSVGEGVEHWPDLLRALGAFAPDAILVLESDRLEANQRSLQTLRQLQQDDLGTALFK
jgi:sugar phosphate isomerase/epimerase